MTDTGCDDDQVPVKPAINELLDVRFSLHLKKNEASTKLTKENSYEWKLLHRNINLWLTFLFQLLYSLPRPAAVSVTDGT